MDDIELNYHIILTFKEGVEMERLEIRQNDWRSMQRLEKDGWVISGVGFNYYTMIRPTDEQKKSWKEYSK